MAFDYKQYYKENRERINRQRRRRYKKDQRYRKTVLQRNSNHYQKVKKSRPPEDRYRIVKSSDGDYYTISIFAKAIKRKAPTVREYHRQEFIPQPIYMDSRGWRLYSQRQVLAAAKLFKLLDNGEISKEELTEKLKEEWDAQ